jgi:Na+-translocating ferredoxin:NAD+ oxidoreductase RnfD subunit
VLFPWLAISPPYHFTEHLTGIADWILPAIIITSGTFLNAKFTKKIPLIVGWVGGFIVQAVLRGAFTDTATISPLLAMTGVAFILFTFYMVTDPATTPTAPRAQFIFGASVALVYGALVVNHVVFGFFFALTAVTFARGAMLWVEALARRTAPRPVSMPIPVGGTEA